MVVELSNDTERRAVSLQQMSFLQFWRHKQEFTVNGLLVILCRTPKMNTIDVLYVCIHCVPKSSPPNSWR